MKKYCDTDALQKSLKNICTGGGKWGEAERMFIEAFSDFVDGFPAADVRESVHGKWVDALDTAGGEYYRCSECGSYIEKTYFANDYMVNFCPNCGADMRERSEYA